ncbi:hypothetical protein LEN26_012535 [Aphanomyces euteiches]|nr:hypothetical protein AeMF1_015133 [Aphanomyces euteiches]KAH9117646.1 hypothetical protein LEN26_012535 [Aphanomyces euteiches]KAH9189835.1 hypothetical protein AeNC1_008191 [Aphanomyces euteiches]
MFTSIAATVAALAATAYGHGQLVDPIATFKSNVDVTAFCDTMNGPKVLPGDLYNTSPQANSAAFTANFKKSSYVDLKSFISANGGTCGACGNTLANGTPKPFPSDNIVKWHHGAGEGFTPSHTGPCELWCDNTRVYQNDDCAANVPTGDMTVTSTACANAKQLTIYWLALHNPDWQIYINCVPLTSGGGAPTPSTSSSPVTQPPATSRPSSSSQPPATPRPSSQTPVTSRPTPSTMYGQCGGQGYTGPTSCQQGLVCKQYSPYYSQCVPS